MAVMRRQPGARLLLLLLALASVAAREETCLPPPEPPEGDATLSPLELLDLGAAAVRYLRAFTTQCWLPDFNAPIAMFDNSWAVALVTIWNDLTVPSNGLGRLVTAMQLQTEAGLMIEDKRPGDALSVLELAVLFTLYPVHHEKEALAAWHRSLASNDTLFTSRRLSLARTLALMSSAQASVGAASASVDALEAAMVAGRAAAELFAGTDTAAMALTAPPTPPPPGGEGGAAGGGPEGVERTLAEVARATARVLQEAQPEELERLLDKRGVKCRWQCGRRSALLKLLVPALRVPLRLVLGDGEGTTRVEPPPDLAAQLAPTCRAGPPDDGDVKRLGGIFAQVVATLQQPLLADIGIQCSDGAGRQLLHRCRDQAAAQFGSWAGGRPVASRRMSDMLAHVAQVEEALWRLDQVLDRAMTGVRLGDGTTWVKSRGYTWVLGSYAAAKLYPQGQGAPVYYQTRRPDEPHVGSTICLDKTYLLDTVLRLDQEGLRGLQYALDNLQYAQFHAGGQDAFWRLLAKDSPLCSGPACQTGEDPLASLVPTDAGAPVPPPPRPLVVDFRFVSEQQLQANLAAATDPATRGQDPFVAAFLSVCLVSCAGLYLYSHRGRLARALAGRARGSAPAAPGSSTLAQRAAATAALREALAGDNQSRQIVAKLHAAIEAAEACGVEKPLVKKAKAALQALKRRKAQGGGPAGAPPPPRGAPAAPPQPQPAASPRPLQPAGSGLSSEGSGLASLGSSLNSGSLASGSGSLNSGSGSLSAGTAALLAAAAAAHEGLAAGWAAAPDPPAPRAPAAAGSGGSTGCSPSRTASADLAAAAHVAAGGGGGAALSSTPPQAAHVAPLAAETPPSPLSRHESLPRSGSGTSRSTGSAPASPLPSPSQPRGGGVPGSPARRAAPPAPEPPAVPAVPLAAQADAVVRVSLASPRGAPKPGSPPPAEPPLAPPPGLSPAPAAPAKQLTPRQQKKLARLQQKHAAAAAAAAAGAPLPAGGAADARGPPASPAAASPRSPASSPSQPARVGAAGEQRGRPLSSKELAALAAREQSFPSKQKKKKAAAAAAGKPGAGDSAGRHAAGVQAAGAAAAASAREREVRRTVSDPLGADQALGTQRAGGSPRDDLSLPVQDGRARHAARWPGAGALWSPGGGETTLNAHAPEFSPLPGRQPAGADPLASPPQRLRYGSAGPGAPSPDAACAPLRGSPFFDGGGAGGTLRSASFSPTSSLSYGASSGSSLDPQQSVAAAVAAAAAPGGVPPAGASSLLAQLQQIWGEGGGGEPAPAPGFGGGLGGAGLLGGPQQAQQAQLAALLFMQQLELQQRLGGGEPGPLSPQQPLPPASADVLRDVLGSPLASLQPGGGGAAAWAGLAAGGSGDLLEGGGDTAMLHSSLSLTSELAAAQLQALRQLGELPDGGPGRAPRSQRASADLGPRRSSAGATSLSLAAPAPGGAPGGAGDLGSPMSAPATVAPPAGGAAPGSPTTLRGHRIESLDLEALGFTESGE